jgi:hypothetical protein
LTDNLVDFAILADAAGTKPLILAEIDSQNPKRLNICYPHKVSGNANIISIDSKYSFNFG